MRKLTNVSLNAPAFKGINTEDSAVTEDFMFAAVADNCIIDKNGRISTRKGFNVLSSDITELGGAEATVIHEFEKHDGTKEILVCGNNKIMKDVSGVLTDITGAAVITNDYWKVVTFNNKCYFFNRDDAPLVYDGTTLVANTQAQQGNEALSAYGRLWVADITGDKHTVYWSDLLDGTNFTTGTSGSININKVWPDGYDEITALAAHNGFLVIFGRHSIVIYQGALDPATMSLQDTVDNVGCIARDSVQNLGSEVIFLSAEGLVGLGRVIQEQSVPIQRLSHNVSTDLQYSINSETEHISSIYSPNNYFYLLLFKENNLIYCFDTRGKLENGSFRVTRWPSVPFSSMATLDDGKVYLGSISGIGEYTGYNDDGDSIQMRWYSHPLSFGDPSRLKMLKKIRPLFIGAPNAVAVVKWAYDFSQGYKSAFIALNQGTPAEYNIDEYNTTAEYTAGLNYIKKAVNTNGHGIFVSIGMESEITDYALSLQQVTVEAVLGKQV